MNRILSTAVLYVLLGKAGLLLAIPPGYASPVFPAAGLAVSFALVFGNCVLPGVWLGSFVLNLWVAWHAENLSLLSAAVAAGLGAGAMLQAWGGRWLVVKLLAGRWKKLQSEREIIQFLLLAGPMACLIASSLGVGILSLAGVVNGDETAFSWWSWWVGDTLGVLIFAPITLIVIFRKDSPWKERLVTVAIPMLITLAAVTAVFISVNWWEKEEQKTSIRDYGDRLIQLMDHRLVAHQETLSGFRRLIELVPEMTFRQFDHSATTTLRDKPDIFALSFNRLVKASERKIFEFTMAKRLREVTPSFFITERDAEKKLIPAADRREFVSVAYISPLEGNRPAIGFDINSEPIRREAIQRARELERSAVTAPIRLVQENQERMGVLLIEPVIRQNGPSAKDIHGFVVGVFKVDELVRLALGKHLVPGLMLRLTDPSENAGKRVFFQSPGSLPSKWTAAWRGQLAMANRVWELEIIPTAEYLAKHRSWFAWGVGIAGLVFAALLQILMLAMTGRNFVIRQMVLEKTGALEELVLEHRSLIGRIPVGVFKFRSLAQGGYKLDFLSDLAAKQLGVSAEEVLREGRDGIENMHPEDRSQFSLKMREVEKARAPLEWQCRLLVNKVLRWIEIQALPTLLPNGDIVWNGIQLDITETKAAAESQRLLDAAVRQSNSAIVITDRKGDIVFVNDAFAQVTGFSREESIGKNPRIIKSDKNNPEVYRQLWDTILANKTWRGELENKAKNGELYWELVTISPMTDDQGEITHFIGIKENITYRKTQEQELNRAKNAAEAADLAKSQFLATMSHEIRTPMNGILGMAQLLLLKGSSEEERTGFVHIILSSGNTLLALLNDILDLSKIEAGKVELRLAPVSPSHLMDEMVALFTPAARQKGLSLTSEWKSSTSRAYQGDAIRIRQMLSNLISNAIKFTDTGEVRITGCEISNEDGKACLEFSVTDTGPGIPADKLSLLFKPFSQIDSSTTRRFAGTGLGLSIVQRFAEMMRGTAGVESQTDRGSRFWFRIELPLAATGEEQNNVVATKHLISPDKAKGLVLLVEDNFVNRRVIETYLRQKGMTVHVALDGKQAIDLLLGGLRPDYVFMDCQMPVMDGYEATRRFRQWEKESGVERTPVLALTAGAFEEDRENCIAAGMDDFLTKPVDFALLEEMLKKWSRLALPSALK